MTKIFIETRGTSRGYDWFDAKDSQIKSPPIPDLVKQLLDTEFESLVLYRESRQLILVVTALKTENRIENGIEIENGIDNRTRSIRNSLIWIADDNEDAKLRSIIIQYLENKEELKIQIVDAITRKPEIKIDSKKIESIGNINNLQIKQNSLQPDLDNKIGNLDKCKKELIDEIKNDSLPKKDGLLIFINYSKQKKTFEELKPWRGLSKNIEGGEWIKVENQKKLQPPTSEKSLTKSNNMEGKQSNLLSIVLAIVLIVSNVFWFYQYKDLNKRYDSLKNKFEPSKIQIEKLNNQLQQIKSAKEIFDEAFNKAFNNVNQDISEATKTYKTEMGNVQKSLSDSVEKLN